MANYKQFLELKRAKPLVPVTGLLSIENIMYSLKRGFLDKTILEYTYIDIHYLLNHVYENEDIPEKETLIEILIEIMEIDKLARN